MTALFFVYFWGPQTSGPESQVASRGGCLVFAVRGRMRGHMLNPLCCQCRHFLNILAMGRFSRWALASKQTDRQKKGLHPGGLFYLYTLARPRIEKDLN